MTMNKKAIVLLSGGLDSATVAAIAVKDGFDLVAVSFDYGQRHKREIESAKKISQSYNAFSHRIINIEPQIFNTSSLSSVSTINVPKMRDVDTAKDIPSTYVPARNILFLSYALAIAEVEDAHDIFIGVNALDYSGYPDCRPEFILAFQRMATIGTKTGAEGGSITIHAPLQLMKKSEIISLGMSLSVDYSITHSCYDPVGDKACGNCDSCILRKKGFAEAGYADPIKYV
jgi:7-cyano-7-deazaguanine synthase